MTVHEQVLAVAGQAGEATALIDGPSGEAVTYAALAERIRTVAGTLHGRGFGPGQTLALWAPNVPPWAGVALGAMAAGGAVSPIGPAAVGREVRHAVEVTRPLLLVTLPSLEDAAREATAGTSVRDVLTIGPDLLTASPADGPLASDPDAPALLPFSGGTTGPPKAVVLTHRNVLGGAGGLRRHVGLTDADVVLAVAPFAHVMGSVVTLAAPLLAGARVVTMPRFELDAFLGLIERHRVTFVAVPPPVLQALAHHPLVDRYDLGSLELIACGAAPLPPAVQRAVERRLPHVAIGQGYGMTETASVIAGLERGRGTRPATVGRPLPGTEVRIDDGELLVRGPQVMAGYLDEPERTREVLDEEGWLRTGDLAAIDEDGSVRIVGRRKELIKVSGYQVLPAELEAILLEHPAVADVAVIGLPDPERGEAAVAVVVPRGELDPDALVAWFAGQVAPYKRLREVRTVDALPRTPTGKLLRRVLVAELEHSVAH